MADDTGAENAELMALQKIDDTAIKLQQEGKYLEALECMERGLVLRQHFFGADSEEVWRACKTVGEMCNLLAMTYLQQEDFQMVMELLKKAEILTERDDPGKAVTFNNMACYYRRQGKLHAALNYLQKAIRIEAKLPSEDVENPADTHLNMCAVLSQLGRHAAALEHAQSSLILLQEELFGVGGGSDTNLASKADRIAVLAIAYHNIGVEQEFLKKFQQSVKSYQKGVEVAKQHLGANHGITITLRNSLIAAKRAIASKSGKKPAPKRRVKKSNATAPTQAGTEKWSNITGAYGDMPGVQPVQRKRSPGKSRRKQRRNDAGATESKAAPAGSTSLALEQQPSAEEELGDDVLGLLTPRVDDEEAEAAAAEAEVAAAGGGGADDAGAAGAGAGADAPAAAMPDIPSDSRTLLAEHLTEEVFNSIKSERSALGFSVSDIIRCGVSNPYVKPAAGHSAALGVFACDASCYSTFGSLFNPVLEEYHAGARLAKPTHVSSDVALSASALDIDTPIGGVDTVTIAVSRNLAGQAFLPGQSAEARLDSFLTLKKALQAAGDGTFVDLGDLAAAGQAADAARVLGAAGIALDSPSEEQVASGAAAGWPTGRGVFVSDDAQVVAAVNLREHLTVVCHVQHGDMADAFKRVGSLIASLKQDWAFDASLGSITADPALLGAATVVEAKLPVSAVSGDVADVASNYGLGHETVDDVVRLWTLSGISVGAATCVQQMHTALSQLTGGGAAAAPAAEAAEPEAKADAAADDDSKAADAGDAKEAEEAKDEEAPAAAADAEKADEAAAEAAADGGADADAGDGDAEAAAADGDGKADE